MFKYEVVAVKIDASQPVYMAKLLQTEIDKRRNSRLVHQTPITKPGAWSYGSKTVAILLTFETKA